MSFLSAPDTLQKASLTDLKSKSSHILNIYKYKYFKYLLRNFQSHSATLSKYNFEWFYSSALKYSTTFSLKAWGDKRFEHQGADRWLIDVRGWYVWFLYIMGVSLISVSHINIITFQSCLSSLSWVFKDLHGSYGCQTERKLLLHLKSASHVKNWHPNLHWQLFTDYSEKLSSISPLRESTKLI